MSFSHFTIGRKFDVRKSTCALFLFIFSSSTYSQIIEYPVQIIGTGLHYGGNVIYKYQVRNSGSQNITRITLGNKDESDSSFTGFAVLPDNPAVNLPVVGQWFPPAIISRPDGWGSKLITEADEGGAVGIDWVEGTLAKELWPDRLQEIDAPQVYSGGRAIAPGQSSGDFSVKLDRSDYAYLDGYASVNYGGHVISIPVIKGDTSPPTLSVTLNPATLWPPDHKLVAVTADIAVKDDYDPAPEIQLVSITANEALDRDDVRGAQPGTDSRKFLLRAERGMVYTVTYSATDGSGNKSTAAATVTVPRDQDKNEKPEDGNTGGESRGDRR